MPKTKWEGAYLISNSAYLINACYDKARSQTLITMYAFLFFRIPRLLVIVAVVFDVIMGGFSCGIALASGLLEYLVVVGGFGFAAGTPYQNIKPYLTMHTLLLVH